MWNKIDPGLATVYSNYLRVREQGADAVSEVHPAVEAGRVNVSVYFTTDLADLQALGFEPVWQEDENRATGTIDLAALESFAEHGGVERIVFGRKGRPTLNRSIPNIHADTLRSLTGSTFSGTTGAGVLIGIIDSGIDFRHPFFLRSSSPDTTRILRIWDPGLVPHSSAHEQSPLPTLLSGGPDRYGVEYTDAHINAELRWRRGNPPLATPVRHRDCDGHGTHVASIAAGDGRPDFTYVGVAPRADLIVVKHFDFQTVPAVAGTPVSDEKLFRDAITYIIRVAQSLRRPVVINCSFGNDTGPHDGFTDDEDWLTHTFSGATGASLVQSAGNAGGNRQHARIEFPAGRTTVDIPVKVYEAAPRLRYSYRTCRWEPTAHAVLVDVWYRSNGPTLSAEVDFPRDGRSFIAGPPLGGAAVSGTFARRAYDMYHSMEAVLLRRAGSVVRNHFELSVGHHRNRHVAGPYRIRLTSSGLLTAHLWCSQSYDGFYVDAPVPPNVFVEDVNLISDTAGAANTITVASYDAESSGDPIAATSSRGPLVDWGGPAQPGKPDLAAPGERIDAAESGHKRPQLPGLTFAENGTSMSAPHVTGVIALMFERRPTLTVTQVRDLLRANVRIGASPPPREFGAGRLDASRVIAST